MTSNFRTSKPCILTLLMCLFMVQQHKRTGLSILQNERNMKGHEGKMKETLMEMKAKKLDDRVARKQVGGREQIEGKKSEVTEDE